MAQTKKIRLKGHETFILREGWITKGLAAVKKNPNVFSENSGADDLGVGTNMAKAIRYWLTEADLIHTKPGVGTELTDFGKLIAKNDLYIENPATLWFIHCAFAMNESRVTSWYVFYNLLESGEFSREELCSEMKEKIMQYGEVDKVPDRSVNDDCTAILNMYCREKEKDYDPEEKKVSPFAVLGLVRKNLTKYHKVQPNLEILDSVIVFYLIQKYLCKKKEESVSIDTLLRGENLPGKVLNLGRIALNQYLDELVNRNVITINRTAGLDMIYKKSNQEPKEIIKNYYEEG